MKTRHREIIPTAPEDGSVGVLAGNHAHPGRGVGGYETADGRANGATRLVCCQCDEPLGPIKPQGMGISPSASLADVAADIQGHHYDRSMATWHELAAEVLDAEPASEALVHGYAICVVAVVVLPEGMWLTLNPYGIELGLCGRDQLDSLGAAIRRVRGWNRCRIEVTNDLSGAPEVSR